MRSLFAVAAVLLLLALGSWVAKSSASVPRAAPTSPVAVADAGTRPSAAETRDAPPKLVREGVQEPPPQDVPAPATGSLVMRYLIDGVPARGVVVTVKRVGADAPERVPGGTSDAQGRVRLDGLAPGSYSIDGKLAGYQTNSIPLPVRAGAAIGFDAKLVPLPPVARKLETQRLSLDFADATGDVVVAFLGRALGTTLVIDPKAASRMRTATVTITARNVTFADALGDLCNRVGAVRYEVDETCSIVTIRADER